MMNPLRSDVDARKLAQQSLDGSNSEIQKSLARLSREAPSEDVQDVASVGLSAMQGVQGDDKLAELSRRRAGRASLEVVRDQDYRGLHAAARAGEEITDPSKAYAPLLASTEAVIKNMLSSSIPGPVGAALALALDLGQEIKKPGHTTTDHSAFNVDAPHHSIGPGCGYDFVGLSGVYHAAFSSVAMQRDVTTAPELASLGSSMLLYVDEGNRRYQTETGGYSSPPDTSQVVARELFGRLKAEAPVWSDLGLHLANAGPDAEGARAVLDAIAEERPADPLNILALGRQVLSQLPEERRETFATRVLDLASAQPDEGPTKGLVGELIERIRTGQSSAAQAVSEGLDQLGERSGDSWVVHGKTRSGVGGVHVEGDRVSVPGANLKRRQAAESQEQSGGPRPDPETVRAAVEQMLNEQQAPNPSASEAAGRRPDPEVVRAAVEQMLNEQRAAEESEQARQEAPAPQTEPPPQPSQQRAPEPPPQPGQQQASEPPPGQQQPQARPQAPRPTSGPAYDPALFGAPQQVQYNPNLFGAPQSVPFDPRLFGAPQPTGWPADPSMTMDPRMMQDPRFGGMDPRMMDPRMMQDPRFGGMDPRMMDPRMMQDPRFGGMDPRMLDPRMQDPRFGGMDPRMMDPRFGGMDPRMQGGQWPYQAPPPDPYPSGRPYSISVNHAGQGPHSFVPQQSRMSGWKIAALAVGGLVGVPLLLSMF
ncbi:MAG: hypothetical protein AMXMBFR33_29240 [Candidatus Xenobia bacterium]